MIVMVYSMLQKNPITLFQSKMPPIVLRQNYMLQQDDIVKIGVGGIFL